MFGRRALNPLERHARHRLGGSEGAKEIETKAQIHSLLSTFMILWVFYEPIQL